MQTEMAILDSGSDDAFASVLQRLDPGSEDGYWQRSFAAERYVRPGLDYEDYAPAYCVGYVGFVQYGGRFDDSERCLCANWERIKGDSRLGLEDALPAMRAAWDRMQSGGDEAPRYATFSSASMNGACAGLSFTLAA